MTLEDKVDSLIYTQNVQSKWLVEIKQALCLFSDALLFEHNFGVESLQSTIMLLLRSLREDCATLEEMQEKSDKNLKKSFDGFSECLETVREILDNEENEQQ